MITFDDIGILLPPVLGCFEYTTARDVGVSRVSGGFTRCNYDCMDDEYVYFTLKWGIQSDCEDVVHTEHYKLPLHILEDLNLSVFQRCELIEDA